MKEVVPALPSGRDVTLQPGKPGFLKKVVLDFVIIKRSFETLS